MNHIKKKVIKSTLKLVNSFFDERLNDFYQELLKVAEKGDVTKVNQYIYKQYSTDFLDLKEIENIEPKFHQQILDTIAFLNDFNLFPPQKKDEFIQYTVGTPLRSDPKKIQYRLYANIKIHKFYKFFRNFFEGLENGSFNCPKIKPECRGEKIFLSKGPIRFLKCKTCGNIGFFHFKFFNENAKKHYPYYFLRREKVVFYMTTPRIIRFLSQAIKILSKSENYFSKATMHLTHEVFPGFGYAFNPNQKLIEQYNNIMETNRESVSFGAWLTSIITDDFIKIVQANKETVEEILNKNLTQKERAKKAKIFGALFELEIEQDKRIDFWVNHLKIAKKEKILDY